MRILYHAINGFGLGHLMRLSAIAVAVREKAPDVHQFIATSANYPTHLKRLNMPVMILPEDDAGPLLGPDRRSGSVSSSFAVRLLNAAIQEYDPRLVVFDTHAPWKLLPKLREEGRRTVLVYRRCREEFVLKALRDGLGQFDLVIVPHARDDFRSGFSRSLVRSLDRLETLRYVGPIVFPGLADAAAQAEVSSRYRLAPADELLLITIGAGGLGRRIEGLLERVCQAAIRLRKKRPGLRVVCVGGPYAQPIALPQGCTFVGDEPALQALIARADLVVSMSGYNTVHEILHSGSRALLVPVHKKAEDIDARVEKLVQRGRARCGTLTAPAAWYEQQIDELLESPRPTPEPCVGAAQAAEEILNVSKRPRRYLLSREPLSSAVATSFRSPRSMARTLLEDHETSAIIRVDWDRIPALFDELGPAHRSVVVGLEIVVGPCGVEEAARRIRCVHQYLQRREFATDELLFCLDDPSGGALLAQLTREIHATKFKALVVRFAPETMQNAPGAVFENLELCRALHPSFKIDVTLLDDSFAFIDQP